MNKKTVEIIKAKRDGIYLKPMTEKQLNKYLNGKSKRASDDR